MKEQEVIKRLNFHKEYARLSSNRVVISETDLETVLSMLKENSAEIEQKNTELAEKNTEIEKLNRQIDLMAERIEWLCKSNGILLDKEHDENFTQEDIKKHFERKVNE